MATISSTIERDIFKLLLKNKIINGDFTDRCNPLIFYYCVKERIKTYIFNIDSDFSSLPNRKHIYIYPDTNEYHITLPLMFKKQWMQKYNKSVYKWEWANDERNLKCKDFNEFVDLFFKTSKSEKTTETIDTSYGVNISPKLFAYGVGVWKKELEDYIGAKIVDSEEILSWQNNNLNILKEFGLNIDSTEQQCIDRIKDVYSRNN